MKKRTLAILLVVLTLLVSAAGAEKYKVKKANQNEFDTLLARLITLYELKKTEIGTKEEALLEVIWKNNEADSLVAKAIVDGWQTLFLDRDYPLHRYHEGEELASELEGTGLEDSEELAFAVLGYQLQDGEMTEELKGRCNAAAAAARSYPHAWLICTGGATGNNNPDKHTEAGMMKDYLVEVCGLDPDRILTDEEAMTTTQNAMNAGQLVRDNGIHTLMVITSEYHQKRGQLLYATMAAIEGVRFGYQLEVKNNYCYQIDKKVSEMQEASTALMQLRTMLDLPKE